MGTWAKSQFGASMLAPVGIVVAGTNTPEFERSVLGLFDEVLFSKDSVYHCHRVRKGGREYAVVFNVYGAAAMVDALTEMFDGGVRDVVFVGYAYGGFKDLGVGSVVVPDRCFHFHGLYHRVEPERHEDVPDAQLRAVVSQVLRSAGIAFHSGANISVPAVTLQPAHANEEYARIDPVSLEMELAACVGRANDIGVRAAGVLIISDNKRSGLGGVEKKFARSSAKDAVLRAVIKHLDAFDLPARESTFSVNEYLAGVIADPRDKENVYRDMHEDDKRDDGPR